jgi:hypothetical protein
MKYKISSNLIIKQQKIFFFFFIYNFIHSDKNRKGKNGSWQNVSIAFREDSKKFLFINGPNETINNDYTMKLEKQPLQLTETAEYKNLHYGRYISKGLLQRLERGFVISMKLFYFFSFK